MWLEAIRRFRYPKVRKYVEGQNKIGYTETRQY